MPVYNQSPFRPLPTLLQAGKPEYSWGSFNDQIPTSKLYVTNSLIATNVATVAVKLWEGPIPVAAQLLSTAGLSRIPNVTNVAINSVTGFTTGDKSTGTILYNNIHADVATHVDSGVVLVPQLEIGETIPTTLTTTLGAGTQFAVPATPINGAGARVITWSISFPGGGPSSSFTADLEAADFDADAQYGKIDETTSLTGETRTIATQAAFLRIHIKAADNAGSGKIVAKILV